MFGGGACLAFAGLAAGEPPEVLGAIASVKSALALVYLVVFGSNIAFSCCAWLLRVSTPAMVSTCACVNPVVAVALGALAGEALHPRVFVARRRAGRSGQLPPRPQRRPG